MAETRGTWSELIGGVGVVIADIFDQAMEQYQPGIGRVLRVTSVTGAQETYTGKTGFGELRKFTDGDNIDTLTRYKTYNTTANWTNYAGSVDVTKNTIEDRDFSAVLDEFKDLSKGANYSQDKSGMQLFNGGFATTVAVNGYDMTWYGDGEPLFSTIHSTVVPGASTQSNASSTSIAFSTVNLETGLVALIEQQTDDGLAIVPLGKPMLVLPPALRKDGLEITESTLDPSNANNAINVYVNGMGTDMTDSLFLANTNSGSDTAWYITIPGVSKLVHAVRQEPRLEKDVSIKNKTATFTVDGRWAEVVKDWRRTWGSKGTLASYSS